MRGTLGGDLHAGRVQLIGCDVDALAVRCQLEGNLFGCEGAGDRLRVDGFQSRHQRLVLWRGEIPDHQSQSDQGEQRAPADHHPLPDGQPFPELLQLFEHVITYGLSPNISKRQMDRVKKLFVIPRG